MESFVKQKNRYDFVKMYVESITFMVIEDLNYFTFDHNNKLLLKLKHDHPLQKQKKNYKF